MEELKELYTKKKEEMKEKYHDAINAIAEKNGVDVGVAFDMLTATVNTEDYTAGIEFDREELKKDYFELLGISERLAKANGLI